MSRYRPPRPKGSPYITPAGHDRLQAELTYLWKEKRPEVTAKVSEAAAQGDRSENAEYIYGKRQLREIDGRIQFLSKRLDELTVIHRSPPNQDSVFFGAWVTLEDATGATQSYRIVGADEFDADPQYISIDAPLARALIGKQIDDEVILGEQREGGIPRILKTDENILEFNYTVTEINYE
ncbi:MAG: transcription elongation factor GreB [Pseudomonadales bacterium]|nr:transcription elongation factor GreB [Pseudomonadales bacterium]